MEQSLPTVDLLSLCSVEVNDVAQELEEQYEARQNKTRQRKGQGYASKVEEVDTGPNCLPPGTILRKTSSETQIDPETLTVDFDKFRRVLQLEAEPSDPI